MALSGDADWGGSADVVWGRGEDGKDYQIKELRQRPARGQVHALLKPRRRSEDGIAVMLNQHQF